jgi:hypothetical protein
MAKEALAVIGLEEGETAGDCRLEGLKGSGRLATQVAL